MKRLITVLMLAACAASGEIIWLATPVAPGITYGGIEVGTPHEWTVRWDDATTQYVYRVRTRAVTTRTNTLNVISRETATALFTCESVTFTDAQLRAAIEAAGGNWKAGAAAIIKAKVVDALTP